MEVTLLGTGDTTGTPTVGCDCATCEAARERGVERTRFSIHVRNDRTGQSLLIDTSPDFRHQFLTHDVALPDEIVITHVHFDHLHGLGNLYRVLDGVPVHAADETDPQTGMSVAETIRERYGYLADRIAVYDHSPGESFRACGFDVRLVEAVHPPLVCYGVVIEDPETGAKCSITGDTNFGLPEQSRTALADPDLLIADAIVPASLCRHHPLGGDHHNDDGIARTFGTKHMTRQGALDLADELDAGETRLVHVGHFYPAEEAFEEPLAVDGERYVL